MKKYLLLLAFSSIATFTFAQFDDTKYVLGGGLNLSNNQQSNENFSYTNNNFGITPSIAKVLNNGSLFGISLGYGYSKNGYDGGVSYNNSFDFGVFYQKFYPLANKVFFNWKIGGNTYFIRSKSEQDNGIETDTSYFGYGMGFTPGLTWQAMDRLLLNASIGGASFNKTTDDSNDNFSLGVRFNAPSFSFAYLLK